VNLNKTTKVNATITKGKTSVTITGDDKQMIDKLEGIINNFAKTLLDETIGILRGGYLGANLGTTDVEEVGLKTSTAMAVNGYIDDSDNTINVGQISVMNQVHTSGTSEAHNKRMMKMNEPSRIVDANGIPYWILAEFGSLSQYSVQAEDQKLVSRPGVREYIEKREAHHNPPPGQTNYLFVPGRGMVYRRKNLEGAIAPIGITPVPAVAMTVIKLNNGGIRTAWENRGRHG
jgi:hypothetical protein